MTITKLEIVRAGVALDISDEINFVHEQNDGFGMPPFHRLNERGPLQHGVTDRGYRLDPRTVNLIIPTIGATWADRYTRRQQLIAQLAPGDDALILRFTDPGGNIYNLDCYCVAGPAFASKDTWGNDFKAVFTLYAPDPSWYDPVATALTFNLGGGADTMLVPTVIPMTVGGSTIDSDNTADYAGTFLSYPFIRITGPIQNCVITNNSTGEKLDFTGVTIAAAHYYDIDTRYGYKTVMLDGITNKISDLTSDSDLATFHIAPHPEVANGLNSINISGINITAATKIEIVYFAIYVGI